MENKLNLLAFDLGSSNGRGILGRFDGERITLEEVGRFSNGPIKMNGMVYWDIPNIYSNMLQVFSKFRQMNLGGLSSFGIDAWGNDYGLLDKNLQLISNARNSRHTTLEDVQRVHDVVPGIDIFHRTGLSSYSINTLYQLHRRITDGDPGIEEAYAMLMIPDLLAFFCTGELQSEYTISTTTMMYNPVERNWDRDLVQSLSIPERILQPIKQPGSLSGCLTGEVAEETGIGKVPYALVGSHDTASAVAAIPVEEKEKNYAFCSSGTWCLLGVETEEPIFLDDLYENGFSNEGTVQGNFRTLKNLTGMWIIQECIKRWNRSVNKLSYDDIADAIGKTMPFQSFIDVDHRDFFQVGDMPLKIQEYCRRTKQHVPETYGEIARCVYESLALKYRWTIEWLERIRGKRLEKMYMVGGGARNRLLNQMTADCLERAVVTGPVEAACMGNLLMQAVALGELKNLNELRQVVRKSSEIETYLPKSDKEAWDEAFARYCKLVETDS